MLRIQFCNAVDTLGKIVAPESGGYPPFLKRGQTGDHQCRCIVHLLWGAGRRLGHASPAVITAVIHAAYPGKDVI